MILAGGVAKSMQIGRIRPRLLSALRREQGSGIWDPDSLANVVDLRVLDVVEQHHRDHRHRAVFGDRASLFERELAGLHPTQIDPLREAEGACLGAEASQAVNPLVKEAAVSSTAGVVEDE